MTLTCFIPTKEISKFRFVVDVVFDEFLGVPCVIKECEGADYIAFGFDGSSRRLVLSNVFLARDVDSFSNQNLPDLPLKYMNTGFLPSHLGVRELPVLFGDGVVSECGSELRLGLDILGSIFYLLSRYEELVIGERDEYARFPACKSIAFKAGFLDRPIVDEYVELLWACLNLLWPHLTRKRSQSETFISCDVDQPFDTTVKNFQVLLKTCAADVIKRRSASAAIRRIFRYFHNRREDFRYDPFYTFDWYMDVCDKAGLKAAFYFIPTSVEPHNGCYELNERGIEELLMKIYSRGHEIGVHGSFQTYVDGDKLLEQKRLLEVTLVRLGIDQKVRGNRQHYLRWDAAVTPELLESAGFEYDTTGGYADRGGFRYGTANEFSMWGWQSKKKLNLKQRPLIIMECSVIQECYMGLGNGVDSLNYIKKLNLAAKNYGGNFSLLWHNSSLIDSRDKELFIESINVNNKNVNAKG